MFASCIMSAEMHNYFLFYSRRVHRLHRIPHILAADRHGWKDRYTSGGGESRPTRPLQQTQVTHIIGLHLAGAAHLNHIEKNRQSWKVTTSLFSPVIFGGRAPEGCSGVSPTSRLSWSAFAPRGHDTPRTTSSNGRRVAAMVASKFLSAL